EVDEGPEIRVVDGEVTGLPAVVPGVQLVEAPDPEPHDGMVAELLPRAGVEVEAALDRPGAPHEVPERLCRMRALLGHERRGAAECRDRDGLERAEAGGPGVVAADHLARDEAR